MQTQEKSAIEKQPKTEKRYYTGGLGGEGSGVTYLGLLYKGAKDGKRKTRGKP
ncbi:hypothetical protein LJE17_04975 [Planktothrix agardhii 1031]|nr:hypothetical protein [Planktothrix agardhii 1031]